MPDGSTCFYAPNDATLADLDGDGSMEIILKWDPSNSKDNSHAGFTGSVFVDAYKTNGTFLWRIDLGPNIRAGAHYTQIIACDLDGYGPAEVIMKTADGTKDATGKTIGDPRKDYREGAEGQTNNRPGIIINGPEYLTVFKGATGEAVYTTQYEPGRGNIEDWGDNYANRSDRFLAAAAHLGSTELSVIMCRGYYTRAVLVTYDWDGRQLNKRWTFDTDQPQYTTFASQGNHNLRIADVDFDGYDEITYGSMAIDHNGTPLYNTHMGHGDAMHLTAFNPDTTALQVWDCHENRRDGTDFRDARTGKVIFKIPSNRDVGRCMAADIDPQNRGLEMWSSASGGIRNIKGEIVNEHPEMLPVNMAVWWDGDLLRELLDHETILKYNYKTGRCEPLEHFENCSFNNGSKSNPCLAADIIGDWREEIITRTDDNKTLRIYTTTTPTPYRFHTFLEDRTYYLSIVTQNIAYNQPTQPGFYFGAEIEQTTGLFRGYQFGKQPQTKQHKQ